MNEWMEGGRMEGKSIAAVAVVAVAAAATVALGCGPPPRIRLVHTHSTKTCRRCGNLGGTIQSMLRSLLKNPGNRTVGKYKISHMRLARSRRLGMLAGTQADRQTDRQAKGRQGRDVGMQPGDHVAIPGCKLLDFSLSLSVPSSH
ncbi:uncharacterized protein BP01DRAFT_57101 [Aspergillus saccharolyticus JOP 1030-1]|uniref:Uncharacterized protein n=1 Tax=Aspergillus saccharolyticus JOP 1030-1 TaxID=1450539 RepID=A0A318ZXE6_9EURO|nr:hypothetical protein BP01DRAFT_57101 [Aspergillus saccharolyticus JOP 1030-1]PYH44818.1 hypothetical protein BP01DRAFT_57101 [Aspergillus saccharolyticus JOP 1030-1]